MRYLFTLYVIILVQTMGWSAEQIVEAESAGIMSIVWAFLNSPIGITVVLAVMGWIAGWVFAKKPKWEKYVKQYKPLLIQAVKFAEKKIPNDSTGGMQKLDMALQYVLKVNGKLKPEPLKDALSQVHAEAEKNGILKKVIEKLPCDPIDHYSV